MAEFTPGLIQGGEALSRDRYHQAQIQEAMQMMAIREYVQQQQQKARQDALQNQAGAGATLKDVFGQSPPPTSPPVQAMAPGVGSQPTPPQAPPSGAPSPFGPTPGPSLGGAIMGGPPAGPLAGQGGAAPPQGMAPPGVAPPTPPAGANGQPISVNLRNASREQVMAVLQDLVKQGAGKTNGSAPAQGAPQSPPGWQVGGTADAKLGGGVAPTAPKVGVEPGQAVSVSQVIQSMRKRNIPDEQIIPQLEVLLPAINAQNKAELDQFKAENSALNAALRTYQQELSFEERKRSNLVKEGQQEQRIGLLADAAKQRLGAPLTGDQLKAAGAQVKAGVPLSQAVPGWGTMGTIQRTEVRNEAYRQLMQDGMSPEQAGLALANAEIGFAAGKSSVTQLEKMKGATVAAIDQLEFNVGKVTEAMKEIGSTDLSPILNAIIRKEEYWTGDPKYSKLFFYMSAAGKESARLQSNGQASIAQLYEGAAKEAREWANVNLTPAMWDEVAQAMLAEGKNRIQNFNRAIETQRIGGGGSSGEPAATGGNDIKRSVEQAGEKYEPDKYEYRMQNGKVQKRLKSGG